METKIEKILDIIIRICVIAGVVLSLAEMAKKSLPKNKGGNQPDTPRD